MKNPVAFGKKNAAEITRLAEISDLALLPFDEAKAGIEKALKSENKFERMWGAMVCSSFGKKANSFSEAALGLALNDPSDIVRVRAAEFLGLAGATDPLPFLVGVINKTSDSVLAVEALNSVVLFQDHHKDYQIDPNVFTLKSNVRDITWRVDYLQGEPYRSSPQKKRPKKKK